MNIPMRPLAAPILIVTGLLATGPDSAALADEAAPVYVTATRTPQTADETLAPLIVIDRETIEANPGADIAELLRFHAGIDIARTGGPGTVTTVFMRGAESDHVLLMIDGVKINPGTIGGGAFQNIRLNNVERIEIVRGPRSTLYGSEAIGGVINIITRRTGAASEASVNLTAGSNATRELGLNVLYRNRDYSAGIEASTFATDGIPVFRTSTTDRGHDNTTFNIFANGRIGGIQVGVAHWQASGNTEYESSPNVPRDQDFLNSASTLSVEHTPTDNWVSTWKFSNIRDELDQNQSADFAHTSRLALDWQNDVQLGDANLLTAGLYISAENTVASSFGTAFDEDTTVNAIFVQDNYRAGKLAAVIGGRYTDHETAGEYGTWNVELGYDLSPVLRFIVANNSGFRAPDSTDRFGFGGNPNLKPELSNNTELALVYHPAPGRRLRLGVFRNNIDDLISYDVGLSQNNNISRTRIDGIELSYQAEMGRMRFNLEAVAQDPMNEVNHTQLLRRARHSISMSLGYRADRYSFGGDLVHTGKRPDIDGITFASTIVEASTVLNLHASARMTPKLTLRARVDNASNQKYELVSAYRTPGRTLFLGFDYRL